MGIGVSIFLMAVGAILTWGLNVHTTHGWNIEAIGIILMIVGGFGLLLSMLFWSSIAPFGTRRILHESHDDLHEHELIPR